MPTDVSTLCDSAAVVAELGSTAGSFAALDAAQLIAAVGAIAQLRRCVDLYSARAAGEVAYRSRRELGHQGIAHRAGFVSAAAMIQKEAQVSKHEAARLIEVGTLLAEVEASAHIIDDDDLTAESSAELAGVATPEWQNLLADGLIGGNLSIDKVDAIRRVVSDIIPAEDKGVDDTVITASVIELVSGASGQSPEQLFRAAKRARDVIDAEGIERREKQQRELRSVRTWWDSNGMHCGSWRLAPEDGALVAEAFDQILSPRRGGPRFVEASARATAEDLMNDVRTDEQIAADAFADLVRLAVDADPGTLFGTRRPAVRVVVTADRLGSPGGHGHLEGRHDAVSSATIDRHVCDAGIISIAFDDDGQCVNVGRDQRLFTGRQRIGLAVRDGGCLFPGCERPPSYAEAHHINPWKAKHGRTDIADGVLLCRRHHMLIHNNKWEVRRDRGDYYLQPPADIDPAQELIPMLSRSPVADQIRKEQRHA